MKRLCDMTPEERQKLQLAALGEMKKRLLADITTDLMICQIEGYNPREYIDELHQLIEDIASKFKK